MVLHRARRELLYQNKFIAFISYDDEHHRVAFIDPGPLADKAPPKARPRVPAARSACITSPSPSTGPEALADHY